MKTRKKITLFLMTASFTFANICSWTDIIHAQKIASAAQVEEKALQKVKNATVVDVDKDFEDGILVYEVELVKGSKKYDITYRVSDGKMLAYGWEKRNVSADSRKSLISKKSCRSLALNQVKNGEIMSLTQKIDDGIDIYKVKMIAGNKKYTLKYHARTGALIEYEWKDNTSTKKNDGSYIGLEKAQEIALAKVPGALVVKAELDTDDGISVYEVELKKGNYEYDFKIHAQTGNILEQEKDWDD